MGASSAAIFRPLPGNPGINAAKDDTGGCAYNF